jgi:hypothetical protein
VHRLHDGQVGRMEWLRLCSGPVVPTLSQTVFLVEGGTRGYPL